MIKHKSSVVNWVQSHFDAHVLDHDSLSWLHVFITDSYDEAVDAFILAIYDCLSKHDGVVGVTGSICDPVLLRSGCWRINCELL